MAKCEPEEGSYFQAHYPRGLPSKNYDLFLDFLNLQLGERVLDVGSGSGMLAAAIGHLLPAGGWMNLIVGSLVFALIFLGLAFLLKALSEQESHLGQY